MSRGGCRSTRETSTIRQLGQLQGASVSTISDLASVQSHTQECRDRIEGKLRETDQGRERLRKAEERISTAVARESDGLARAASREAAEEASTRAQPPSEVRESTAGLAPSADEDS